MPKKRWLWIAAGALAAVALGSGALAATGAAAEQPAAHNGVEKAAAHNGVEKAAAHNGAEWAAGSDATTPGSAERAAVGAVTAVSAERVAATESSERVGADGAFIVTVTRVRCSLPAVGPAKSAKGEFCLVNVEVENAGQEARRLDGSAQRAVDVHGRAYAVDERAAAFRGERLLGDIPANTTVRGVLPFAVPPGTRLSALLIHGSDRGRGSRIPLS